MTNCSPNAEASHYLAICLIEERQQADGSVEGLIQGSGIQSPELSDRAGRWA